MKTYITIVDPEGAALGHTGQYSPVTHRVLFEHDKLYGYQNIQPLFSSIEELMDMLSTAIDHPIGSSGICGRFTWHVESNNDENNQSCYG